MHYENNEKNHSDWCRKWRNGNAYSLGQMGMMSVFMIPLIFRLRLMQLMKQGELRPLLNYMNVLC